MNRRSFLSKTLLASAAAWGFPTIIPSRVLGRDGAIAPSNRIALGMIGTGGMGVANLNNFIHQPDAEILAICDVDRAHRDPVVQHVINIYSSQGRKGYTGPASHEDFREMLARPEIDAVVITTPDHWHALIAIAAMAAGKDVYGEKPLARTIREGQAMVAAVRRYGRVFQTGTQSRSSAIVRDVVERVRNGRIGKLERISMVGPQAGGGPEVAAEPVPEGFNYDLWLGPAPLAPYQRQRCHGTFRAVLDYSGGTMTDHGTHRFDVAQWAANKEATGPVEIEGQGVFPRVGIFDAPSLMRCRAVFEDGLVYEYRDDPRVELWGMTFHGTAGWIHLPMQAPLPHLPVTASHPSILREPLGARDERVYFSNDHHQNFLECIRTRRDPVAPIEIGHRSTTLPHLCGIAMRIGRKLQWDPQREMFPNDQDANAMLTYAMREPWRLV